MRPWQGSRPHETVAGPGTSRAMAAISHRPTGGSFAPSATWLGVCRRAPRGATRPDHGHRVGDCDRFRTRGGPTPPIRSFGRGGHDRSPGRFSTACLHAARDGRCPLPRPCSRRWPRTDQHRRACRQSLAGPPERFLCPALAIAGSRFRPVLPDGRIRPVPVRLHDRRCPLRHAPFPRFAGFVRQPIFQCRAQ